MEAGAWPRAAGAAQDLDRDIETTAAYPGAAARQAAIKAIPAFQRHRQQPPAVQDTEAGSSHPGMLTIRISTTICYHPNKGACSAHPNRVVRADAVVVSWG